MRYAVPAMNDRFYTISEFTRLIKATLTGTPELNQVWLKGEITNLTYHSSGHIYFTLKDEGAVISSVFFKYANRSMAFRLEEGMSVFAFGSVGLFEKRGSYQLTVSQVRLEGAGELQKRIEQLKKKLLAEGLFDPARRRRIPFLPRRIGVVTSPTGAALRDIIKVATRRFPNVEILIAPALVQGAGAADSVARGIEELNDPSHGVDVIIAGRGGGSFEDLMPFSEEVVVRAFANSRVPIISAVGHQVDHPLCDDAADAAAPTPSAAAEIAVPVKVDLQERIDYCRARAYSAMLSYVREATLRIDAATSARVFRTPRDIVETRMALVRERERGMIVALERRVAEKRRRFLSVPDVRRLAAAQVARTEMRLAVASEKLQKLSPLGTLRRGYAVARGADGKIARSVKMVAVRDRIDVILRDGALTCTVDSISRRVIGGKEEKG
ncbi:MAG TPA: exodeoxyribonuclease VII large subunit [Spirochaetota bacterium]|nr:exodeoxyribonuclease VII large subunit [Spirochaetota bacterium]